MKLNTVYALVTGSVLFFALAVSTPAQTVASSNSTPDSPSAPETVPDQVTPSPLNHAHNNTYVIGDDDMIEIDVWKETELSKQLTVRSDGKISMPLVGEIQAAGKTPVQLEDEITTKLRSFITEPAVTVMVLKINSLKFNVMGEVARPGSYSLAARTTIVDAIATAGGFRDFAKKKSIYVLHQKPDGTEARLTFNYSAFIKGKNPKQNILLQSGDTVVVP
jgi:polysaccharide export outer membrane protein